MPRDTIPTPLTTARFPADTLRFSSEYRRQMFSAFDRMRQLRTQGPRPWDRQLRAMDMALVRSANRFAPAVLP